MLNKRVISYNNVTVLDTRGKRALADLFVTANYVSHGVRRCNAVFTFERRYTYNVHVNVCDAVKLLAGFLQCNGGKLENA